MTNFNIPRESDPARAQRKPLKPIIINKPMNHILKILGEEDRLFDSLKKALTSGFAAHHGRGFKVYYKNPATKKDDLVAEQRPHR